MAKIRFNGRYRFLFFMVVTRSPIEYEIFTKGRNNKKRNDRYNAMADKVDSLHEALIGRKKGGRNEESSPEKDEVTLNKLLKGVEIR